MSNKNGAAVVVYPHCVAVSHCHYDNVAQHYRLLYVLLFPGFVEVYTPAAEVIRKSIRLALLFLRS